MRSARRRRQVDTGTTGRDVRTRASIRIISSRLVLFTSDTCSSHPGLPLTQHFQSRRTYRPRLSDNLARLATKWRFSVGDNRSRYFFRILHRLETRELEFTPAIVHRSTFRRSLFPLDCSRFSRATSRWRVDCAVSRSRALASETMRFLTVRRGILSGA